MAETGQALASMNPDSAAGLRQVSNAALETLLQRPAYSSLQGLLASALYCSQGRQVMPPQRNRDRPTCSLHIRTRSSSY